MLEFLSQAPFVKLQKQLQDFFKSFPDLPASWVKFIVKAAPAFSIIAGILSIISALPMFGLGTVALPLSMVGKTSGLYIMGVISIITGFMLISAYQPLKNKQKHGVSILVWSSILSTLGSLMVTFSLGTILGLGLSLYITFQIAPKYTK